MRANLFCLLSALVACAAGMAAPNAAVVTTAVGIHPGNNYGAPIPPWETGCQPGWYYGQPSNAPAELASLVHSVGSLFGTLLCDLLRLLLGCAFCPSGPPPPTMLPGSGAPYSKPPPPPPAPYGYSYGFQNLTCAIQIFVPANAYETFGLVDSPQACADMCTANQDCWSANYYHDNNSIKSSPLLTCSLFRVVATQKDAINCGQQQQLGPQGPQNSITSSYLLIKSGH
ncbi:unnamed protein product [Mycena citricolor]|uniref:Apple domain-containing protein n=1 Tax=Mycena citricolor TaxID=2018698 RepID=A0AAD2K3D8_9AGAR|nr:unnamed protein product [Mycena citricolor]CAK5276699.1 unnamed protein product [Mycena citricolor]